MVMPVFAGETVGRIQGTVRSVSLPSYNNASIFSSIYGTLDINYSLFFIDWRVAASYTPTVDAVPSVPQTVADFDTLMKRLVLVYGSTSSEFYGSNPDEATGNKLDLEDSPKEDRGTGSNDNKEAVADTELGLGPTGIIRLYNSERFLSSTSKLDVGKDLGSDSPDYAPANSNLQDCVFQDNIDINMDLNVSGNGFLIFLVTRYNTEATAGYACSYGSEAGVTPAIADTDRRRFLSAAFNGDQLRVKSILADPTSQLGKYARALMFRGDTSVHPLSDTATPSLANVWSDSNVIRPNNVLVNCKFALPYQTPYTIAPDLLG